MAKSRYIVVVNDEIVCLSCNLEFVVKDYQRRLANVEDGRPSRIPSLWKNISDEHE